MINLTASRKEELTKYLELLIGLRISGIECDEKIQEALEELHSITINKANNVAYEVNLHGWSTTDTIKINSDKNDTIDPFNVFI